MEFTFIRLISLFLLFHLTLNSAHKSNQSRNCHSFNCGTNGKLSFPFSNLTNPECGFFVVNCTESTIKVRFQDGGEWYNASGIDYNNTLIGLYDEKLKSCDALNHFSIPTSKYLSPNMISRVASLIKCKRNNSRKSHQESFRSLNNYTGCKDYEVYYYTNPNKTLPSLSKTDRFSCSNITLPPNDLATWLPKSKFPWGPWFLVQWKVPPLYHKCHREGDFFRYINGTIQCKGGTEGPDNKKKKVAIGVGTSIGVILLACAFFLFYVHLKKLRSKSSALISRCTTPDSSLKPEYEKGRGYFQTPIFTYNELQEATNNFDSSKELGDGGFGTVYRGNLWDGRVVAVKRLYENNYKRIEQFMNEITILSGLHHQNLVTLCGCTSRHSRELLLVYEYVPNGTVAYHLYGDHAVTSPLSWPVRMGIAIETADALTYLHASDTIHRDVKTSNILLDNNYHVKVADFGLSRLFPTDATHISTAPQGTPGYVDPAYYQCYQLNDKSDVYSFGVVLIELISSKPAVDINRRQDEINLSNMAINKIHNDALHELVDPSLGFETNYTVRMMITMVAELAFRCLQLDKDMRPSMSEVLQSLKEIQRDYFKMENAEELDIRADATLLKNFSPNFCYK